MTTHEMTRIMTRLDAKAKALLCAGADETELLAGMADDIPDFKSLLDTLSQVEVDREACRYPSLRRFASVLAELVGGVGRGSAAVRHL